MKTPIVAIFAGLFFGAGLAISGMTDTRVVLSFLTVNSAWNPSLAFVMMGALAVTIPGFKWIFSRQSRPLFADNFSLPLQQYVDRKLVVGAALFGIGWGLLGYCPGPALTSVLYGHWQTILFLASMLVGAYLGKKIGD